MNIPLKLAFSYSCILPPTILTAYMIILSFSLFAVPQQTKALSVSLVYAYIISISLIIICLVLLHRYIPKQNSSRLVNNSSQSKRYTQ